MSDGSSPNGTLGADADRKQVLEAARNGELGVAGIVVDFVE